MYASASDRQLKLGDTVRVEDGLIQVDWELAGITHKQLDHCDDTHQMEFWFTTNDLDGEFAEMTIHRGTTLVEWLKSDYTSLYIESDLTIDQ